LGISQNPFLLPQITHLRSSSINLPERIFRIFWNSLSLFYQHNLIYRFLDVSKISFGDLSNPTEGSTVAWPHRPLACTRLHTLLLDHVPTSAPFPSPRCSTTELESKVAGQLDEPIYIKWSPLCCFFHGNSRHHMP
jgi:hypothetical protein